MTDAGPSTRPGPGTGIFKGLSSRLLALTAAFVLVAQFLAYSPSIAFYARDWLRQRIVEGNLAAEALEAAPVDQISDDIKRELLTLANARAVTLEEAGAPPRVLSVGEPPPADAVIDLRTIGLFELAIQAYRTLLGDGTRVLLVVGVNSGVDVAYLEVLVNELPLRDRMRAFSLAALGASFAISLFTAALLYLTLQMLIVRPLRRLSDNMTAFREAPEDPGNVIVTTDRADEIGEVQRGLASMEGAIRASLRQRARLAALGTAVAKITHDLRSVLSTAQLLTDRLATSSDPNVRKSAPSLTSSIDRAVAMSSQALDFAREDTPLPQRSHVAVSDLFEEAARVVNVLTDGRVRWEAKTQPGLVLSADRDQLFRALVNLGRNSVEAGATRVKIVARLAALDRATIDISDDGPGLPPRALEKLFMPFSGSVRPGGTGLGLAIARELVRGHGGELTLLANSSAGAVFRIELPGAALQLSAAE